MPTLASPLRAALRLIRGSRSAGDCLVCHEAVRIDDDRMRLPGGGFVHSGCSTYRMRQRERERRTLARVRPV
jgi:hypothetical protein